MLAHNRATSLAIFAVRTRPVRDGGLEPAACSGILLGRHEDALVAVVALHLWGLSSVIFNVKLFIYNLGTVRSKNRGRPEIIVSDFLRNYLSRQETNRK